MALRIPQVYSDTPEDAWIIIRTDTKTLTLQAAGTTVEATISSIYDRGDWWHTWTVSESTPQAALASIALRAARREDDVPREVTLITEDYDMSLAARLLGMIATGYERTEARARAAEAGRALRVPICWADRAGVPVEQIAAMAGVTRAHVYRVLEEDAQQVTGQRPRHRKS